MAAANHTGKTCPKCRTHKPSDCFWKASSRKDGLKCYCIECISTERKQARLEARIRRMARATPPILECRDCKKSKPASDFYTDKRTTTGLSWACKSCVVIRASRSAEEHPERARASARAHIQRKRRDPAFRARESISRRISKAVGRESPGSSVFALLGYSIDELRAHLERQFLNGMNWDNYGEWHIDHIVPLSSFHFETSDDPNLKRAWCLTNLRPLWAKDNRRKHAIRTHLI